MSSGSCPSGWGLGQTAMPVPNVCRVVAQGWNIDEELAAWWVPVSTAGSSFGVVWCGRQVLRVVVGLLSTLLGPEVAGRSGRALIAGRRELTGRFPGGGGRDRRLLENCTVDASIFMKHDRVSLHLRVGERVPWFLQVC